MQREKFRTWIVALLASCLFLINVQAQPSYANQLSARLVDVIDVSASGTDTLNLGTDGTNLLILHNVTNDIDLIRVFDTTGNLINEFSAGSRFTDGISFTGTRAIFNRGTSINNRFLFDMDLSNGAISGPFTFTGPGGSMTFDGSSVLRVASTGPLFNQILLHDTQPPYVVTGTLSRTPPPIAFDRQTGITWLGGLIYAIQNPFDQNIYVLDTNLDLLATVDISFVDIQPRDITALDGDLFVADRGDQAIYRFTLGPSPSLSVTVDIKPGNDQDRVNICAKGAFPVAIFSTETFDAATEVDPTTVFLAGAGVKRVGKDERPLAQRRDANKDGIRDLVVKILNEDLELEAGDTVAMLLGQTFDGVTIEGLAAIDVKHQMCVRTLE